MADNDERVEQQGGAEPDPVLLGELGQPIAGEDLQVHELGADRQEADGEGAAQEREAPAVVGEPRPAAAAHARTRTAGHATATTARTPL